MVAAPLCRNCRPGRKVLRVLVARPAQINQFICASTDPKSARHLQQSGFPANQRSCNKEDQIFVGKYWFSLTSFPAIHLLRRHTDMNGAWISASYLGGHLHSHKVPTAPSSEQPLYILANWHDVLLCGSLHFALSGYKYDSRTYFVAPYRYSFLVSQGSEEKKRSATCAERPGAACAVFCQMQRG